MDVYNVVLWIVQIDVENPCVIMSQDKSREFLHSGNDKDKFKVLSSSVYILNSNPTWLFWHLIIQFFFKATLLQQVNDLLENIDQHLNSANGIISELEDSVKPIEKELNELQEKIDNMKHVEKITQELQELKKKLAWSWVYKVDSDLQKQAASVEKLKDRIPVVQAKIDGKMVRELLATL